MLGSKVGIYSQTPIDPSQDFILTVQANNTFALPLVSSGNYNFIVLDWGDGSSDHITSYNQPEVSHTYSSSGQYTITIRGSIEGFNFSIAGNPTLLEEVSQWGGLKLGNDGSYFQGCSNLAISATDNLDLSSTTNMESAFEGCSSLTNVPAMNSWDWSGVTTMLRTFKGCTSFNTYIGDINVRNATLKFGCFEGCSSYNQSNDNWDMELTVNLANFYLGCSSFNQRFDSWNLSSCVSIGALLFACTSYNQPLTNLNLTNSSLTTFELFFFGATSFNQPLSFLDTSSIGSFIGTFQNATGFDQDLSALDFSALTNASNMFNGVTLSTVNYDALLIKFDSDGATNVTFHGGGSQYSAGAAATARSNLVGKGWTITDGGQVP
jgi:hypothetical protein